MSFRKIGHFSYVVYEGLFSFTLLVRIMIQTKRIANSVIVYNNFIDGMLYKKIVQNIPIYRYRYISIVTTNKFLRKVFQTKHLKRSLKVKSIIASFLFTKLQQRDCHNARFCFCQVAFRDGGLIGKQLEERVNSSLDSTWVKYIFFW